MRVAISPNESRGRGGDGRNASLLVLRRAVSLLCLAHITTLISRLECEIEVQ